MNIKFFCCCFGLAAQLSLAQNSTMSPPNLMSIDFICNSEPAAKVTNKTRPFFAKNHDEQNFTSSIFSPDYRVVKQNFDRLINYAGVCDYNDRVLNGIGESELQRIDKELNTHYFDFDEKYLELLVQLTNINVRYPPQPVSRGERKEECDIRESICLAYSQFLFLVESRADVQANSLWYFRNSDIRVIKQLPYSFQNANSVSHIKRASELYKKLEGFKFQLTAICSKNTVGKSVAKSHPYSRNSAPTKHSRGDEVSKNWQFINEVPGK
ncbi:MAG: hypothetical protein KC505_00575 [Myxococcales bacterium]|nr:hypothetical protein [Myxococcales bacterium]USN51241.1 MAG: hypothetical protein H6731_02210 [Myxococcales bacterium]